MPREVQNELNNETLIQCLKVSNKWIISTHYSGVQNRVKFALIGRGAKNWIKSG